VALAGWSAELPLAQINRNQPSQHSSARQQRNKSIRVSRTSLRSSPPPSAFRSAFLRLPWPPSTAERPRNGIPGEIGGTGV
jgi:hypothetical protein